jgi:uncharacterized protein YdaL
MCCCASLASAQAASAPLDANAPVLILYDRHGDSETAYLGELYAMAMSALVSHFGAAPTLPVERYRAGDMAAARAVIYIGSTYDEPLPQAFLDDVRSGARPVLWLAFNIWQLSAAVPDFAAQYGYLPGELTSAQFGSIIYKSAHLDRELASGALVQVTQLDTAKARVLAWAAAANGRQVPWGLRSKSLTYIAENPLAYVGPTDRYFALADLLFELLAPETPERHRALVRLEDVHANTPPEALRAFADYFASAGVPFSIALVPMYTDPLGTRNGGVPTQKALHEAPAVVAALKYMLSKGGTLVLHGYTHQYGQEKNPYSGTTVDDFEFFRAHVDENNNVIWDGPVAEDSAQWAGDRIRNALAEIEAAGLPRPTIFEYPHYGGSVIDSVEIARRIPTAYQGSNYYGGMLSGTPIDYRHSIAMTFPFVVHDMYGWKVIPENLGNYVPVGYNNHATTSPADLQHAAQLQHVVRDGVVSFFFHPMFDIEVLRQIVDGIRAEGYTFVAPDAL